MLCDVQLLQLQLQLWAERVHGGFSTARYCSFHPSPRLIAAALPPSPGLFLLNRTLAARVHLARF
jgi:hypothetical protein